MTEVRVEMIVTNDAITQRRPACLTVHDHDLHFLHVQDLEATQGRAQALLTQFVPWSMGPIPCCYQRICTSRGLLRVHLRARGQAPVSWM